MPKKWTTADLDGYTLADLIGARRALEAAAAPVGRTGGATAAAWLAGRLAVVAIEDAIDRKLSDLDAAAYDAALSAAHAEAAGIPAAGAAS